MSDTNDHLSPEDRFRMHMRSALAEYKAEADCEREVSAEFQEILDATETLLSHSPIDTRLSYRDAT